MGSRGVKFVIILLLQTSISGCINETKVVKSDMTEKKATYLALGDSYTIGESVADTLRWPVQLSGRLHSAGINISEPIIIARTGWTTGELIQGITDAGLSGSFDLVSLLIGVNNQYRGGDPEIFRNEFVDLIEISKELCNVNSQNLFVLTIPDWGVTPFASGRDIPGISREIDLFNGIVIDECRKAGVPCFDITDISRKASQDDSMIAGDGLHPSGEMYAQWVERILPGVIEIILN